MKEGIDIRPQPIVTMEDFDFEKTGRSPPTLINISNLAAKTVKAKKRLG